MVTAIATDRGLQLLDELEAPLRELQERQFAMLSEDEIKALIDGLEKVREGTARIPG
jgi:DNA-binding MarR family transcriptional regulator